MSGSNSVQDKRRVQSKSISAARCTGSLWQLRPYEARESSCVALSDTSTRGNFCRLMGIICKRRGGILHSYERGGLSVYPARWYKGPQR